MTAAAPDGPAPQMRLPGSVAEVDASPEGPGIGAFFDLDGTLVAGYTAAAQTEGPAAPPGARAVEFLTIVQLAVQFRLGRRAFETLIEGSGPHRQGTAGARTSTRWASASSGSPWRT